MFLLYHSEKTKVNETSLFIKIRQCILKTANFVIEKNRYNNNVAKL